MLPGITGAGGGSKPHGPATARQVFFDDRFPEARHLARAVSDTAQLSGVRGDVTELWNTGLDRTCLRSALSLQGVTTESFYFCLKGMLESHASVHARVSRVSRNLLMWTIESRTRAV